MNPLVRYTLGRIGLFAAVLLVVLPTSYPPLLKLLAAVLVSAVLAWFVLRGWREDAAAHLAATAERRRAERDRRRDLLAGDGDDMT
jgi:threonine/homoserine/homoserine lactone efflux protein